MEGKLAKAVADLDEEGAVELVEEGLKVGVAPYTFIEECRQGMDMVGELYRKKTYFLSELIMSSEVFKAVMKRLGPLLEAGSEGQVVGRVVLGTPQGDIHDIGKGITATLLQTAGFKVFDLGVDVAPQTFVAKLKETGAQILGMSALLTPSFGPMKEAVELLAREGLRGKVKVIIGGGVTTEVVREYVGADAQTLDVMEGVEVCRRFVAQGGQQ